MNIDLYRTPYPHAIRAIYLESVLPLTPQILYKPLHPLQTTTDLLFSPTCYKLLSTLYTPLRTVTRPLLSATNIPSTCHKLLLPIINPF
jgi:hypothetical protein